MNNPIFVTGASRSGTTMLSRILGNHSTVLGLNELHFFGDLFDAAKGFAPVAAHELEHMAAALLARQSRTIWGSGPTADDRVRARAIYEGLPDSQRNGYGIFAAVLQSLCDKSGKKVACEQTPRNIFYAEQILAALPEARIIHIARDPRAVLASQKNRWKLRRMGAKNVPRTELIRTWVNYHPITVSKLWVGASRHALRLIEHPRFMLIRFEDVLADPKQQVARICAFLGIEFELPMLEVNQWGSSNLQHELHKKGISKEVLSQWETSLSEGEQTIAERISREPMQSLTYPVRPSGGSHVLKVLPYLLTYPAHLIGVALANPRRGWIQLKATLQSAAKIGHNT